MLRADRAVRAVPPTRPLGQDRNTLIRTVKQARLNAKTPLRVSRSVALAVREARALPPSDAGLLALIGSLGLLVTLAGWLLPEWLAGGIALLSGLVSINLLRIALRRYRLYRRGMVPSGSRDLSPRE